MAKLTVTVKFGPRPTKLLKALDGQTLASTNAAVGMIRVFVAFLRKRYAKLSRGGGEWPPLKPATIARRRNKSDAILRDTGLMFAQFSPELQKFTNLRGKKPFSAVLRFGSTAYYPDGASVAEIMSYQHHGSGHLPVRRLVVPPDAATKRQMAEVVKREIKKYVGPK